MGRAKERMIELQERGYDAVDGAICAKCVSEPYLATWIDAHLSETACRFCGRKSKLAMAASFDDFVGLVLEGISFDWNHPDVEGIMYISAEGGYQAPISNSWEVLPDYDISDDHEVVKAVIDAIHTEGWVEREYYRGDESQRLKWGWDWFKHVTKHQTRYLFLKADADDDPEDYPPSEMLDLIGSVLSSDLGGSFIKSIAQNANLYRIRIGPKEFGDAGAIGPPPEQFANQSNRMSPAGIPMFYGAFDADTAKAETFDPTIRAGAFMSIGAFQPMRDLKVLDLADLPDIPSVFDVDRQPLIHSLRFLHSFTRDLVQPIARDGREHVEYVPTQIVTEYFRRVFRAADDQPIDGMVYRSSRNGAGRAIVLFCENDQCVDAAYSGSPNGSYCGSSTSNMRHAQRNDAHLPSSVVTGRGGIRGAGGPVSSLAVPSSMPNGVGGEIQTPHPFPVSSPVKI